MVHTINAKQLRAGLPEIVKKVLRGERFVVIYRSRPAFKLVPLDSGEVATDLPLDEDPVYRAKALGKSSDGLAAADHDDVLYGGGAR